MYTLLPAVRYLFYWWSGRYYDPDEGYVVVSTDTPFVIYDDDDGPLQGLLVITGDTGSEGGRTKAWIEALSSTTFQVKADTDGDGFYDWESGDLDWSDF